MCEDGYPSWLEKAVLVYGPKKSGTTLLQNLLDGGEELLVRPEELKFNTIAGEAWKSPNISPEFYYENLTLAKEYDYFNKANYKNNNEYFKRKDYKSLKDLIIEDALNINQQIERKPKRIKMWAAKSVGGSPQRIITNWKHFFYDGRLVVIIRNPLMIIRSIVRDRRRKGIYMNSKLIFERVKETYRVLFGLQDLIDDKNVYFVIYEDLTKSTNTEMKRVAKFLGIEYEEAFSYPSIFKDPVVVNTSSKEVKKVFSSNKKWYNDLTSREIFYASLFSAGIAGYLKLRSLFTNRKGFDYKTLCKDIRNTRQI